MESLAIVGSGVAGLACAHFLSEHFDVTLFESESRLGGHTCTIQVQEDDRTTPIDVGFMVYNEVTYPNLTKLFKKISVSTQATSMSFSVQSQTVGDFCGSSVNHLFARRRNIFSPRFWRLLYNVNRFNSQALADLSDAQVQNLTLAEYVDRKKFHVDLLNEYLVPMSSAVWSTPPEKIHSFPVVTLLQFFYNHGFLGLSTQHPWRTVTGGSSSYIQPLLRGKNIKIQTSAAVLNVRRQQKVELTTAQQKYYFDRVIFACHADEALAVIGDATAQEQQLLSAFSYQTNKVVLHCDDSVMPKTRLAWSSWNYQLHKNAPPSLHYWMNSLQNPATKKNYFVSLNHEKPLKNIVWQKNLTHPIYNLQSIKAQLELPSLNTRAENKTYFCGSYFNYGFHEDALTSGINVCKILLGKKELL